MTLKPLTDKLFANQHSLAAVLLFTITVLITLAPFCSQLFQCGCTWPWDGLDQFCNYHNEHSLHHCPWCSSFLHGYVLLPLTGLVSTIVIWWVSQRILQNTRLLLNSLLSAGAGLLLFYTAAFINAWFAVQASGYPYFPI